MSFLDRLLEIPQKAAESATEAIVRLPEVPLKIGEGIVDGAEKGMDKLMGEDRRDD